MEMEPAWWPDSRSLSSYSRLFPAWTRFFSLVTLSYASNREAVSRLFSHLLALSCRAVFSGARPLLPRWREQPSGITSLFVWIRVHSWLKPCSRLATHVGKGVAKQVRMWTGLELLFPKSSSIGGVMRFGPVRRLASPAGFARCSACLVTYSPTTKRR